MLAIAASVLCSSAGAADIASGSPDVVIRFDNSVRYNLGVRAQKRDPLAFNNTSYDESDSKFDRGDIVTNRIDLMTEFDVVYKKRFGARVSGAAWYDHAYRNSTVTTNPGFTVPGLGDLSSAYPRDEYSRFTKRWNHGPSGEILDAFVFGGVDIGTVPVDFKAGRHNVYWGESLFSFVHGVAYSQGPVDIRRAYANPGVEAKELFMSLPQISGTAQLAENFSGQAAYR